MFDQLGFRGVSSGAIMSPSCVRTETKDTDVETSGGNKQVIAGIEGSGRQFFLSRTLTYSL